MKQVLIKAIVNWAAFLEFSDEESLNPDTAVNQMENLAATLEGLTQEERREFLDYLKELAVASQRSGADKEYVDFLSGFGESFGLVEEEPKLTRGQWKYIEVDDDQPE